MKGVRLDFKDNGRVVVDFSKSVNDFDSTIQNTVVNLAAIQGSDMFYSDKGTFLREQLLSGGLFVNNAHHSCNFAAAASKSFINHTMPIEITERINEFRLEPQENLSSGSLVLKARSKSSTGNSASITWEI